MIPLAQRDLAELVTNAANIMAVVGHMGIGKMVVVADAMAIAAADTMAVAAAGTMAVAAAGMGDAF